jgi:hypothetical protein
VNPYRALQEMGLGVDDLPALAPHLSDGDYMAWVTIDGDDWTLHRVNRAVAGLVNDAACRLLADPETFPALDGGARKAQIDRILLWAEANAGKPREALAREAAEGAKDWASFRFALSRLAEMKPGEAIPVIERRKDDFPDEREEVEALIRALSAEEGEAPEEK